MADRYQAPCQTCGKIRIVSRATIYLIEKKAQSLNCLSCSSLGNKKRFLGKPYDNSLYGTAIYRTWVNMKTRCTNKNISDYKRYGGRGITICEKWFSFGGFLEDMQATYKEGLTLDRIDNNGNYEPGNCRWANKTVQARNTRNIERAKRYTYNGISKTVREWAEEYNIKRSTLDMRLRNYGMTIEKALNQPVRQRIMP